MGVESHVFSNEHFNTMPVHIHRGARKKKKTVREVRNKKQQWATYEIVNTFRGE